MLINSTSFGDSSFAGTHTRNKEKTNTRRNRNTQKTSSCVTLTRWAQLTEKIDLQDGGPSGSVQDERRRERQHPRAGRTTGSADPMSAPLGLIFGGKIDHILLKAVPSVSIFIPGGNRPPWAIKGASLTPHNTHHQVLFLLHLKM